MLSLFCKPGAVAKVEEQRGMAGAAHVLYTIPGGDEHGWVHSRPGRPAPFEPHARPLHGQGRFRIASAHVFVILLSPPLASRSGGWYRTVSDHRALNRPLQ